jgi:hypothetical protein
MKPPRLFVVFGSVLIVAFAGYFLFRHLQGVDSPITVADGSIDFTRPYLNFKGFHHENDPQNLHHWVKDSKHGPTGIDVGPVGAKCPTSCTSYPLTDAQDWTVELNDHTTIQGYAKSKDHEKIDIQLKKTPSEVDDYPFHYPLIEMDGVDFTTATLTIGSDAAIQLQCPTSGGCMIMIHYETN